MTKKARVRWNDGIMEKYRSFELFYDVTVTEGGWWYGKAWMTAKMFNASTTRWWQHGENTGQQEPDYDTENHWIPHQCGGCRWFAALDSDWGICCGEGTPNDGRIVFEHNGCVSHSYLTERAINV
jgi:hypothetical protein